MAVVVITTFDLDEYVYAALKAGARGFLSKDAGAELLTQAVHAADRSRGKVLLAAARGRTNSERGDELSISLRPSRPTSPP